MYQTTKKNQGFTLIELMLSTVFIGSLLLVITMVIMQATSMYNRGLTIKEVNSVSRVVVRDMQQTIMNSEVFALRYYNQEAAKPAPKMANRFDEIQNGERSDYYVNSAGGRLCTGTYSYAWNSGRALKAYSQDRSIVEYDNNPIQFIRNGAANGLDRPVGFVKVRDTQKQFCRAESKDGSGVDQKYYRYLPPADAGAPIQNVFGEGNNNLVLYRFEIDAPGSQGMPGATIGIPDVELKTTAPYYTISLVVGTQTGDEELIQTNEVCKPPADATVNEGEYCAVNKINFVARSGAAGR